MFVTLEPMSVTYWLSLRAIITLVLFVLIHNQKHKNLLFLSRLIEEVTLLPCRTKWRKEDVFTNFNFVQQLFFTPHRSHAFLVPSK